MKFQSWRLIPGSWRDPDSGIQLDGSVGLRAAEVVDAISVRDAMTKLRSGLNPSPIVTVVDENDRWAQRKVRGLM